MPGGGLMQLVAIGAQNEALRLRNVAYEYHTYQVNGVQSLSITRFADIVNLEYLELTFSNSEISNVEDVKHLVLNMFIGGQLIQQFPLSLLINLNEPIMCDGKMYINLCFDMLFGGIKLIGLQYRDVRVEFKNDNALSCISSYGIVSKLTYLDIEERRNLAESRFEEVIQQLSFIDIMTDLNDVTQMSNVYDICLPFTNISKGFFIECNNVDNLNNINLKFNSQERFNLNRFLVRTKCKKINQNLLYFPFNYDKDYSDRTAESYEGSPNLSRIDSIKLKLDFDIPINNVKIYSLNSNIYRQMSGMGGLAYTSFLSGDTYDLRDNTFIRTETIRMQIVNSHPASLLQQVPSIRPPTVNTPIVYTGPINKPILITDASNCPILCEQIGVEENYMSCHQCKNNFSETAIKQWLEGRRPVQRTCPLCRVPWSNFEIYVNVDINSEGEHTPEPIVRPTFWLY
jgi:hypothetical protein